MTVSYISDVSTSGKFVCFWSVLMRWRGSLYKLIYKDLLFYCVLYLVTSYVHMYVLSSPYQFVVTKIRGYLTANISLFPVPFFLSFFVDQVATKWWHQYQLLPSPDTLAIYTNAAFPGRDDQSRLIRRTIVRYTVLSLVLTLRNISVRIKKRFPTIKQIQDVGLILEDEMIHYDKLETQVTANNWMPLVWAANVVTSAKNIKKASSEQCVRLVISELTAHRDKLGILVGYDLVTIPLVYTQSMVVVVISYMIVTLLSQQPPTEGNSLAILGSTVFSIMDFIIYVGLMKVATVMLNPFGEDDDDFELNATVDRHITAAYMIVDEMHVEEPDVVKDAYWDQVVPEGLPYTVGSLADCGQNPNFYDDICLSRKKRKSQHRKMISQSEEQNRFGLQKGLPLRESFRSEVDSEVYEVPDPTMFEKQMPGTSKQYIPPKRF